MYLDTEDTFSRDCMQGLYDVFKMEKFSSRHSAKKCIKYPLDIRDYLQQAHH